MMRESEIKDSVRKRYGEIATQTGSCCSACACSTDLLEQAKTMGYSEQELGRVPDDAMMGLGCGNPTEGSTNCYALWLQQCRVQNGGDRRAALG